MSKSSKAEDVYKYIKKQILSGKWVEGDRLNDSEIAEELGVSQLSVRAALFRLMESGVITNEHWKGFFIKYITDETVSDLVQIRIALESCAIRNFIPEYSPEQLELLKDILARSRECLESGDHESYLTTDYSFHETIYRSQHNEFILMTMDNLQLSIHLLRYKSMGTGEDFVETARNSIDWHTRIYEAIRERDAELAVSLLVQHLSEHQSEVRKFMYQK